MRKLVSIATLITCMCTKVDSQNFQQFPFQPKFQSPPQGEHVSENSLYLPPDTQTAIPYFPLKNNNNLQFQYLPPTGTKAPSVYPSPFPMVLSTPFVPSFDDDENEDEDDKKDKRHPSSPRPQNMFKERANQTQNNIRSQNDKKEMRSLPQTVSYNHPIDRVDIKFGPHFGPTQLPQFNMQAFATRRALAEAVKSEPLGGDQMKSASFHGAQHYMVPPQMFGPSTTEPAIPILRLSNEMDLDGSYSYEALGADQTHYVQHSRMENMGSEKEEQVVEGSYSYVGDNGQTYTVHYVADSNGFRASGDHLPVGPPVPEIIQRSVQYNLAEEAKRPHHLQEWHEDERNNEIDARDRTHRFSVAPPPSRGLYTGRTPEAFSYNFPKLPNNPNNNIVSASSAPVPIIAHLDMPKEEPPKQMNGPIAPQITFLASQGAHVPSMNPTPSQQSISRVFNVNNEKPSMPKLMSYELTTIENEHENNKPLWRWQYGLNANSHKNAISRSSSHNEDEVAINFNDMTPEQYTYMIRPQLNADSGNNKNDIPVTFKEPEAQFYQFKENINTDQKYNPQVHANHNIAQNDVFHASFKNQNQASTEQPHESLPFVSNWLSEFNNVHSKTNEHHISNQNSNTGNLETNNINKTPKLITQDDFIPPSQTVTQSYDYDEGYYEPRKIKSQKINYLPVVSNKYLNSSIDSSIQSVPTKNDKQTQPQWNKEEPKNEILENVSTVQLSSNIEYSTLLPRDITEFQPIRPILDLEKHSFDINDATKSIYSTTEITVQNMLENNIFLKNLLSPKVKSENESKEMIDEKPFTPIKNYSAVEKHEDKAPKAILSNHKTLNDMQNHRQKPVDISNILNYVSLKNHFESSKIRPKSHKINNFPSTFDIPRFKLHENIQEDDHRNEMKEYQDEKSAGIIKKYKTLQRNNNYNVNNGNTEYLIRRDLTPPHLEYKTMSAHHLPPLGRAGPTLKSYLPPIYV